MERNINYVLIGAIFCALTIAMIGFIFWIGKFGIDERRVRIYHVYTQDDISGISINTPIKYKGISVGSVLDIAFKSDDVNVVQIDVGINKKIPVRDNSELIVDSDGFVGMSYLNLKINEKGNLIENDGEGSLYLGKNSLSKLLGNAEEMGADVQQILSNVKGITDSKNMEEILKLLSSFQSTKDNLDATLVSANKLLKDLDKALLRGDFNVRDIAAPLINKSGYSLQTLNVLLEKAILFMDRMERDPYETLLGKRND